MKVRVFQLARELKMTNEALVKIIADLGGKADPKSDIEDDLLAKIRERISEERNASRHGGKKETARVGTVTPPPRPAAPALEPRAATVVPEPPRPVAPVVPPPAPAPQPLPPRPPMPSRPPVNAPRTDAAPPSRPQDRPQGSPSGSQQGRPQDRPQNRPPDRGPQGRPQGGGGRPPDRPQGSGGRPPQGGGSSPQFRDDRGRPPAQGNSNQQHDSGGQRLGPSRTPHIGTAASNASSTAYRPTALGAARTDRKRRKKKGRTVDEQAVRASVRKTLATLDGGRGRRRRRRGASGEEEDTGVQPLRIHDFATVAELASVMEVRPAEVIAKCLRLGIIANINRQLEKDEIAAIMDEFGHEPDFVTEYGAEKISEEDIQFEADEAEMVPRAPIVTVMGHVDHGKTTLLDTIRKTKVTEQESGGITQHIGAYRVELPTGAICFLDTPGHEAFTAMRARGAKVTDAVVLVVAANDEVRPQTVEAINHAKAASVPLIAAINKVDVAGANPDLIRKGLSDAGVLVETWGGKVVDVEISAKKGMNVDKLLEMIVLEAELLDLRSAPSRAARGAVIEARRDPGRGIVATVLVQDGTLRVGDFFVCGAQAGRVRAMVDERGTRLKEVGASTPVEIMGWSGVPMAGDTFAVMHDEAKAREIASHRAQITRAAEHRLARQRTSLVSIHERIQAGEMQELNVIIKADVGGSVEVLRDKLESLSTTEVKVRVIHAGVGLISESDVQLAMASKAIIVGFHTRADARAHQLALVEDVEIRLYRVIYEVEQEIKDAMSGLLAPEKVEKPSGSAEVRQVFEVTRVGTIAGCMVVSGKIHRNDRARLYRGVDVIHDGPIASLKRHKDDAREVASGFECGIGLEGFDEIKEGDVIEAYTIQEVARKI